MTPEGRVKEDVKKVLRSYGVYYHMPVQNGMGQPSLDFVTCPWGFYFAIETKARGKEITARQHRTILEILRSGGYAMVCDGSNFDRLDEVLRVMRACKNGEPLLMATLEDIRQQMLDSFMEPG